MEARKEVQQGKSIANHLQGLGLERFGSRHKWPSVSSNEPDVAGIEIEEIEIPEILKPHRESIQEIAILADVIRTFQADSGEYAIPALAKDIYNTSAIKIKNFCLSSGITICRERNPYTPAVLNAVFSNLPISANDYSPSLLLHWGVLSTWRNKSVNLLHSFFIALRDEVASFAMDSFDEIVAFEYDRYFQKITEEPQLTHISPPRFVCANSIARGGEAAIPPYHFAYFFPEDHGHPAAEDNTVVLFIDSYRARFLNVSLPLALRFIDPRKAWMNDERLFKTQLLWFRGHDISHGMKTSKTNWDRVGASFGSAILAELGEVVADVFGFLFLFNGEVKSEFEIDAEECSYSFMAEMLNYLRRDPALFFDSAAAHLELTYLWNEQYVQITDDLSLTWRPGMLERGIKKFASDLRNSVLSADGERIARLLEDYSWRSRRRNPAGKLDQFINQLRACKL